ncbi:MAG: glycosyltransferase, partial [Caulobacterales bacterium]|nr:glycosyltransferase [Caulobacterales bacterium]
QLFLRAFARLAERRPEARAILIGDGPMSAEVADEIVRRGLGDTVNQMGAAPGSAWMEAFDLFALPSRYEGLPYVMIEALFKSLPIVTTDVGGAREVVVEGRNGFITPQEDEAAFAARLEELVDSASLRGSFAAASRELSREFELDRMVERVLDIYARVLAGEPPAAAPVRDGAGRPAEGVRAD